MIRLECYYWHCENAVVCGRSDAHDACQAMNGDLDPDVPVSLCRVIN